MPVLGIGDGRDAILEKFHEAYDALDDPPSLAYQDRVITTPENVSPRIEVLVEHEDGRQRGMNTRGNRRFESTGIVTVRVYTAINDGLGYNDELAGIFVETFEGETARGGVWFRNVRSNEIGPTGLLFQTNVIAEFQYDRIR